MRSGFLIDSLRGLSFKVDQRTLITVDKVERPIREDSIETFDNRSSNHYLMIDSYPDDISITYP